MNERLRILLVEDNPLDREMIAEHLRRTGLELEMEEAPDGRTAVARCTHAHFDCALLDCHLPDLDGLGVLYEMKAKTANGMAVLVLTGDRDADLPEKMIRAGATDYLLKEELTPRLLGRALRYALARNAYRRELVRPEVQTNTLQQSLAAQSHLTGWQQSSTTGEIYGTGPLKQRDPETFATLQSRYEGLLELYLESLVIKDLAVPRGQIGELGESLGQLDAGPRDVVELHLQAVSTKSKGASHRRATAVVVEGRLLALELMGHLVDYYRARRRRSAREGTRHGT